MGRLLACLCMASFAAPALAADFPTRPITLVVPYQAGGTSDGIARALASAASKDLGQPVVVDNKAGAEGLIGSMDVQKAPPDGYRVLWGGAGSMMVVPALRKHPQFDPVAAFTPIAGSVDFSFFLYVHPGIPANNLGEFVAFIKANPGKYNYAVGSNQGMLSSAYLNKSLGLDMEKVTYKGEPAIINDLIPGRVQAMFGTSAAAPHVKDGTLKALVTTLPQRSPLLPGVPTMKESGFKDLPFSPGGGWLGIFGPAGMERPVVERLNKAFVKALTDPDVKKKMEDAGLTYTPFSIDGLAAFVKDQRDLYKQTVKELEIPLLD
jgi:tripartite-type tricarboxylate transporter receptor subunit TctC